MPAARPDLVDVERAIRHSLASGRSGIVDVAQIASTSTSTLQRALADRGTCFSVLRRRVRVNIALRLLTNGKSLRLAASEVALTPDHLSVILKEETGLCPRQIIRATELRNRVARWQKQGPPSYGSLSTTDNGGNGSKSTQS
jgi:AraC-like DNA-binding protein